MISSYIYKNTAASVLAITGPGVLHSVMLTAAGDTATVIVYDQTSAAVPVLCKLSAVTLTSAHAVLDVSFSNGLYIAVTGTTPDVTIAYASG